MENSVKHKIIQAAREAFFIKGYDGARMQSIANAAGVNKAMLHYYFSSKENLFKEIVQETFQQLFPTIEHIIKSNHTFFEKLEKISFAYAEMLQKNQQLPVFIVSELHKGNVKIKEILPFREKSKLKEEFAALVQAEINAKRIKNVDPTFLFINLLSLSIFPYMAKGVVMLALDIDEFSFALMNEQRKKQVAQFIIDAIKL